MKKTLLTILLIFTTGFVYASTKEAIMKDLETYNMEINQKVIDRLGKIEQETIVIDNIFDNKAKGNIDTSLKIIDNYVKDVVKFMQENTSKLKTKEVRDYHLLSIEYIQIRHDFLKEAVLSYKKFNKITDEEKERLSKKYGNKLAEMDKKNAELLKALTNIVH